MAVGCPGGQTASTNPTFYWTLIPSRKLHEWGGNQGFGHWVEITRGLGKESEVGGRDFSPITGVVALQFADKPQRSSSAEDLI